MKKLLAVLFALTLAFMLLIPAGAAPGDRDYVFDYADVLTDEDEMTLDRDINDIIDTYSVGFCILIKYGDPGFDTQEYADSFIDDNPQIFDADGFTGATDGGGMISVLDMDSGSHLFYTLGTSGSLIFSDEYTDPMYDKLVEFSDLQDYSGLYTDMLLSVRDCVAAYSRAGGAAEQGTMSAAGYGADYDYSAPQSGGAFVSDMAELLTDEQEGTLTAKIQTILDKYSYQVVLHTTNSIGGKSIQDYSDDFFDYNGYGVGESRDGMVFVLNMNNGQEGNRDYYTSTRGYGLTAFTDYAVGNDGVIYDEILPMLKDGDYYGAFNTYLYLADTFLAQAKSGESYDINNDFEVPKTASDYLTAEAIVIFVALLTAFVVTGVMKRGMNTAVKNASASEYTEPGSLNITNSNEIFIHKSVSRTAKPQSSSGSGGSSSHTSSSGASHGGGGGKF